MTDQPGPITEMLADTIEAAGYPAALILGDRYFDQLLLENAVSSLDHIRVVDRAGAVHEVELRRSSQVFIKPDEGEGS